MLTPEDFNQEDILNQNCKVGRTYKKCQPGKLCHPADVFDMIEECKECKQKL